MIPPNPRHRFLRKIRITSKNISSLPVPGGVSYNHIYLFINYQSLAVGEKIPGKPYAFRSLGSVFALVLPPQSLTPINETKYNQ